MKPGSVTDLKAMISGMAPALSDTPYCFQPLSDTRFIPDTAFALIREAEGAACILPHTAAATGAAQFAQITLNVHSDLEAVGLTAAVSGALAASGIACNVVAGLHHDHLFVPWDKRGKALDLLERLSREAHR